MTEVRISALHWDRLATLLTERRDIETKAFLLGRVVEWDGGTAFLVREVVPVPEEAYEERSPDRVVVRPEFVHGLLVRCAQEGLALLEAHTHPWQMEARFSGIDHRSNRVKFRVTQAMSPPFRHGALVFGGTLSFEGSLWDYRRQTAVPIERLKVLGRPLRVLVGSGCRLPEADLRQEIFDRQIRAFGKAGQQLLGHLTIGIVGLGGLGSQVAQALALLGVRRLILVDPDRLEMSNANRVVGVRRHHFRRSVWKVRALADGLRQLPQTPEVEAIPRSVLDPKAWQALLGVDILVGAVDAVGVRQFLNAVAVACLIPYLDAGVGLRAQHGHPEAGGGQVQVVVPGETACYACLNPEVRQAVEEQMTVEERQVARDLGYIRGEVVPNPQVVFLNGVVAHQLVWELVKLVTGCGPVMPYTYYDLLASRMFPVPDVERRADCLVCSPEGWLGLGPEVPEGLGTVWPDRKRLDVPAAGPV